MSLVVLILYRYDTTGDPALKPVAAHRKNFEPCAATDAGGQ